MTALLLSNSQQPGQDVFKHAEGWINELFKAESTVMYVPYGVAAVTDDPYEGDVMRVLTKMGYKVVNARNVENPIKALDEVDGVLIGGGNTFRLLKELQETGMLDAIKEKVEAGMPFMGTSAGTNVACPTIKTTNDKPIVCPKDFNAMGLIDFQINTHYQEPDPDSKHMGESTAMRIGEFHEEDENHENVLGTREGSAVHVSNDGQVTLLGDTTAVYFRKGHEPVELQPGSLDLN